MPNNLQINPQHQFTDYAFELLILSLRQIKKNQQGHKQVPYQRDRWHSPLQKQSHCLDCRSPRGKRGSLCRHTSHPWRRPRQVGRPRWHQQSRCSHCHRLYRRQQHPWSRTLLGTASCWRLNTKHTQSERLRLFWSRLWKTPFLQNCLSQAYKSIHRGGSGLKLESWKVESNTKNVSQHHFYCFLKEI